MTDHRVWELERSRTSYSLTQKAKAYDSVVTELLQEIADLQLLLEQKIALPNDYLDRLQQFENLKKHVGILAGYIGYAPLPCANCDEGESVVRVPEPHFGPVVCYS